MVGEIHVALTEGFSDDTVEILLEESAIFARPGVTTEAVLGLAASVEAYRSQDQATLTVKVPTRQLVSTVLLPVPGKQPCYVGVSIEGDHLFCRLSAEPFGYV